MKMYCKKCGKELKADSKFCSSCGQASMGDKPVIEHTVKKESSWTMGRVIKIILITVAIGVGLFLKFGLGAITYLDNDAVEKNNKGISSLESGDGNQAISELKNASENALTNETKLNTLKNLAYAYSSEGKNDLASKTFNEALALTDSNSFDYYLISGEIASLERKPDVAVSNYNKAYQMKPNDFQINNALNLFYLDLEETAPSYANYPKALTHAQNAYNNVGELDGKITAKENLAIAYFFNEKYNEALPLFLSMDLNKNSYINYWLGLTYIAKEDENNARFYLRKAKDAGVELEPELYNYL